MSNPIVSAKNLGDTLPKIPSNQILLHGETGVQSFLPDDVNFKFHRLAKQFENTTKEGVVRYFSCREERDKFLAQVEPILSEVEHEVIDYGKLLDGTTINATMTQKGNGYLNTANHFVASTVLANTFLDASVSINEAWWLKSTTVVQKKIYDYLEQLEDAGALVNRQVVKEFNSVKVIEVIEDSVFLACNPMKEPMHFALFREYVDIEDHYPPIFYTSLVDYHPDNRLNCPNTWDGRIEIPLKRFSRFMITLSRLSIPLESDDKTLIEDLTHNNAKIESI